MFDTITNFVPSNYLNVVYINVVCLTMLLQQSLPYLPYWTPRFALGQLASLGSSWATLSDCLTSTQDIVPVDFW